MNDKTSLEVVAAIGPKIKLHGDRIAVVAVDEETECGGLLLPQDRTRLWFLARVAAVGDGIVNGEVRRPVVAVGDLVLMQQHGLMLKQCSTRVDGHDAFIIPQGDALAQMDGTTITYDTYHTIGRWVLCDVMKEEKVGTIFLPNGSQTDGCVPRYTVAQLGSQALEYLSKHNASIYAGTELLVNRQRATPIQFGVGSTKRTCVYLDVADILGAIESAFQFTGTVGTSAAAAPGQALDAAVQDA